ncbi:MAG TPA: amidophosphoribosyltransferase, partial [Porticoccaceae bacterium]|nr:amidophosphoribosyltransferase [Porticoccaceae bacterium]
PNVYGIDIPNPQELIAHGRSEQEVCELIGADWLIYQDIEDLIASAHEGNPAIERFDCAVFNGEYVTDDVDESYLDRLAEERNDAAKTKLNGLVEGGADEVIGLHNPAREVVR